MILTHFTERASTYTVPLFRLLHRHGFRLEVVYRQAPRAYFDRGFSQVVQWETDLTAGYHWRVLGTVSQAEAYLEATRPGAVWLHGTSAYNMQLLVMARRRGIPVWLRGESSWLTPTPVLKRVLRSMILPRLFWYIQAFLCIGIKNREFYESYGVPKEKLHWVPYAVDNTWWAQHSRPYDPGGRVIYVGKLLPEKGVRDLVATGLRCVFVGDGPLRAQIEAAGQRVTGFQQPTEIAKWLAEASCVVVPSHSEPWGLVVNEALASGRPVIASERVNAASDLILPSLNGLTYQNGDVDALREMIARAPLVPWKMATIQNTVARYCYEADLAGIRGAMEATCASR